MTETTTEKKVTKHTEDPMLQLVAVTPPRKAQDEDDNVFIGVSTPEGGTRNYLLPRGKTSMVPMYVAIEYNRSESAKQRLEAVKSGMAYSAK